MWEVVGESDVACWVCGCGRWWGSGACVLGVRVGRVCWVCVACGRACLVCVAYGRACWVCGCLVVFVEKVHDMT